MKKITKMTCALLLIIATVLPGTLAAQQSSQNVDLREYQRQYYKDYARWSIGANLGFSAMWGDLRSFAEKETNLGGLYGLTFGYQLSPTMGFTLSGEYGSNRLDAITNNKNFRLDDYAYHYRGLPITDERTMFSEVYSKVQSWHIGLTWDINLNNLIGGNNANRDRRWTVIASPGIYAQSFDPVLKLQTGGNFPVKHALYNDMNLGLGGDLALRWKASKAIDVQVKTGMRWINNRNFDGIHSTVQISDNGMAHLSAGIVWKLGTKKKVDHLLYASTRRYVSPPVEVPVVEPIIKVVERVVEVPVEKIVQIEVKVAELQMPLPTVHFKRDSAVIDEVKYADQLQKIVAALKSVPDAKIQILGYADHTGSANVNDRISLARAKALKDYLVRNGISSDRITGVKGMGADRSLTGKAAFSVEARRAEVVKN